MPNGFCKLSPKVSWDAKILTVEFQHDNIVVYYENDTDKDQEFLLFLYAVQTGKSPPEKYTKYLKTMFLNEGNYVLHFYTNND
jgi:hypothetical protein